MFCIFFLSFFFYRFFENGVSITSSSQLCCVVREVWPPWRYSADLGAPAGYWTKAGTGTAPVPGTCGRPECDTVSTFLCTIIWLLWHWSNAIIPQKPCCGHSKMISGHSFKFMPDCTIPLWNWHFIPHFSPFVSILFKVFKMFNWNTINPYFHK